MRYTANMLLCSSKFPMSDFVATPPRLVRTNASQNVMTLLSACDASYGIFPASVAWLTCTNPSQQQRHSSVPQLCSQEHLSPFPPAGSILRLPAPAHTPSQSLYTVAAAQCAQPASTRWPCDAMQPCSEQQGACGRLNDMRLSGRLI